MIVTIATSCARAAPPPAPPPPVLPAPPPHDDGGDASGGRGGTEHESALEQLKVSPLGWRSDRQNSVRVPLPDAAQWTRVKFAGIPSLAGFRYGSGHHAVVGATIVHVDDEAEQGACSRQFEEWAGHWLEAFEVDVKADPPQATAWNDKIVDIDSLVATTGLFGSVEPYAVAFAAYPAWPKACVVLGIAVPARGDLARAKAVRDRYIADALPKVQIVGRTEPPDRY